MKSTKRGSSDSSREIAKVGFSIDCHLCDESMGGRMMARGGGILDLGDVPMEATILLHVHPLVLNVKHYHSPLLIYHLSRLCYMEILYAPNIRLTRSFLVIVHIF